MMTRVDLQIGHFEEFIREAYPSERGGRKPFPWQEELASRAVENEWPETIAVPTASGKTSILDIAVFAMAMRAEDTAFRRIFFAVDRRVVVEEAYQSAKRLAFRLREATPTTPVLFEVAQRLRELSGHETAGPLEVFQLRGGIYRDRAWARSPLQPLVVTTTVDQLGSRLLYRAYGSGPRAWPAQAGLVANDSLIVLDEAHCSNPFQQTMAAVARFREWGACNLRRKSTFVCMSATPRGCQDVLELGPRDHADPTLGPRLRASKLARLVISEGKGAERLAERMVELALQMEQEHGLKSVGILVNRVQTARTIYQLLSKRRRLILTGRMRSPDRDRLYAEFNQYLTASPERARPEDCLFTVATQCIEVGANIDFEGLVTECSSLDSLRQRFGRLDRLGLRGTSPACVVIQNEQIEPKEPDPIYAEALPATWMWLNQVAKEGVVDFGIEALKGTCDGLDLSRLVMAQPDAPVLLPAYLDRWVQTSPPPKPDPDPAVFLHGPTSGVPDLSILWRADLPSGGEVSVDLVKQMLSAQPPAMAECAPVPFGQFLRWLNGRDIDLRGTSDLEIPSPIPEGLSSAPSGGRRAFLWRGLQSEDTGWVSAGASSQLRPGDVLIVSAIDQSTHAFVEFPQDTLFWDLGDVVQPIARRRCSVRLNRALLDLWSQNEFVEWCARLKTILDKKPDFQEDASELKLALADVPHSAALPQLSEMIKHWLGDPKGRIVRIDEASWVLTSLKPMTPASSDSDTKLQDDFSGEVVEVEESSVSSTMVTLRDHCKGVAALAERFARGSRLTPEYVALFRLAGELHDLGKADPRFQAWLFGGNAPVFRATRTLWAKSDRNQTRSDRQKARRRSGYPQGGRHELVSARILCAESDLLQDCVDPDLLIHLVASHHGYARPFSPFIADDSELTTEPYDFNGRSLAGSVRSGLERLDSGQPDRFWRLVRRYGWWGLAWLESLLILADQWQSNAEGEVNGRG